MLLGTRGKGGPGWWPQWHFRWPQTLPQIVPWPSSPLNAPDREKRASESQQSDARKAPAMSPRPGPLKGRSRPTGARPTALSARLSRRRLLQPRPPAGRSGALWVWRPCCALRGTPCPVAGRPRETSCGVQGRPSRTDASTRPHPHAVPAPKPESRLFRPLTGPYVRSILPLADILSVTMSRPLRPLQPAARSRGPAGPRAHWLPGAVCHETDPTPCGVRILGSPIDPHWSSAPPLGETRLNPEV